MKPHSVFVLLLVAVSVLAISLTGAGLASRTDSGLAVSSSIDGSKLDDRMSLSGQVTWTASSSGTPNRVEFLIDGSSKWTDQVAPYQFGGDPTGRFDTTSLSDGQHRLTVKAYRDAGNNHATSLSVTVTISNGKNPPPPPSSSFVVTSSVADGATLSGSLIWTATPSGTTVSSVDFLIDGSVKWTENVSPYVFNGDPDGKLDTATLSNGAHTLSVEAHAGDGRTATTTSAVTVANGATPPPPPPPSSFVVTSSVADGAPLSGSLIWTAKPSGTTVSSVDFLIDGSVKWTERIAPYQFNGDPAGTLDTTTLDDGAHTLRVEAHATDGRTATASSSVTVKNGAATAPVFAVTSSIADGATIGGSMIWTAVASGDTISKVEFLIDGTTKWTDQVAPYQFGGDPAGRLDTTSLKNGQHMLRVTAYGTGGISVTALSSVTVSNAASPPTPGSVLWAGNYETGDFSQWWLHEWSINPDPNQGFTEYQVGHSSATIVTSPVAQGRYASKFQVFPTTGTNPNDRAEILATQAQSGGYPGQEWWYGWWTDFPGPSQQWWDLGGDWNAITQFFSTDNVGGQIGLGIDATSGTPRIFVEGMPLGKRILTTLQYDHWYHFVVHARWAIDSTGLVEIFVDGVNVVPLTHGATLRDQHSPASPDWTSPGMHMTQGIYRGAFSSTNTVIHDGLCRADSYSAAANC